jgi:hypothetical protein
MTSPEALLEKPLHELIEELDGPINSIAGACQALDLIVDTGQNDVLQAVAFILVGLEEQRDRLDDLRDALERKVRADESGGNVIANEVVTIRRAGLFELPPQCRSHRGHSGCAC